MLHRIYSYWSFLIICTTNLRFLKLKFTCFKVLIKQYYASVCHHIRTDLFLFFFSQSNIIYFTLLYVIYSRNSWNLQKRYMKQDAYLINLTGSIRPSLKLERNSPYSTSKYLFTERSLLIPYISLVLKWRLILQIFNECATQFTNLIGFVGDLFTPYTCILISSSLFQSMSSTTK
jgi:hypothetical protein